MFYLSISNEDCHVDLITRHHIGNKNMRVFMEMYGRFMHFLDSRLTKKHLCISGSNIHVWTSIEFVVTEVYS